MIVAAVSAIVAAVVGLVVGYVIGHWARSQDESRVVAANRAVTPVAPATVGIADVLAGHTTGVVIADAAGFVDYRNAASERLRGTHTGTLLDAAVDRHLAVARDGGASRETVEFYGPPRAVFDVRALRLPGGGSVAFVDDVSERHRLDRMRTDFVANISHELRTPIGALSVLAETIADESDPATIKRIVGRMLAESERATSTIDDLIELSRIETGGERAAERVVIGDVVQGAVERVAELAVHCGIAVSVLDVVDGSGHRSDGLVVAGDRRELVSALGNLVENAVKYSDPGSSVTVRARRDGDLIEIAVADHGVGIPQRDLDRVFERFYRVDRARSRTTGGTGLGLSIVRHVASNHGGDVVVTSTEGEGSTFVLRLPALLDRTDRPGVDASGDRSEGVA